MKNIIIFTSICFLLAACVSSAQAPKLNPDLTETPMLATPGSSISPTVQASISPTVAVAQATPTLTPSPLAALPQFEHIAMLGLENRSYEEMVANPAMPFYNKVAVEWPGF